MDPKDQTDEKPPAPPGEVPQPPSSTRNGAVGSSHSPAPHVQAELAAMARDIRDTKAWVEAKLVPGEKPGAKKSIPGAVVVTVLLFCALVVGAVAFIAARAFRRSAEKRLAA